GGDVGDHAADERVDHVERRDVHQHASRALLGDPRSQIVLQRERELVVHVDLDGDQQERSHLEDRDAFHQALPTALAWTCDAFSTLAPVRLSATMNASASEALVVTSPRFTPRCTMVCAICGRMPLMMQSAPIRRVAATVFSRCCE